VPFTMALVLLGAGGGEEGGSSRLKDGATEERGVGETVAEELDADGEATSTASREGSAPLRKGKEKRGKRRTSLPRS
jgi:hypothetical protein